MKILLVNPYIYDFTAFDLWLRPLGLLYIASVIKEYTDCEIFWIDTLDRFANEDNPKSKPDGRGKYRKESVEKPSIYENIPRYYSRYGMESDKFNKLIDNLPDIDIVLFTSLMTYWIEGLNYTVERIKKRFPDAKYILGGILPTLAGNNFPGSENFNIFVSGYGEKKILDILNSMGCKISEHPNLSIIDNIPFPAYELMGSEKYLPLMTSRGCPFNCSYCASHLLSKGFFQREPENILREIEIMHDRFGTEHFIIFDDAFLINKKNRFIKVFQEFTKDSDLNFHTPNGLHAREIDRETAEILFNSGFKTIRLSFESTDIDILKKSSDKINIPEMIDAVEELIKAGYKKDDLECYLLFGIPGQDLKKLENSIDFVRELGIKPRLSYFSPVPGTVEYLKLVKSGILPRETDLLQTNKIYFLYEKSGFSLAEINHIKDMVHNIISDNICENI